MYRTEAVGDSDSEVIDQEPLSRPQSDDVSGPWSQLSETLVQIPGTSCGCRRLSKISDGMLGHVWVLREPMLLVLASIEKAERDCAGRVA